MFGSLIFIQDPVPEYHLPGLYSRNDMKTLQVLNQVRVNTSVIFESADDGTIFLNIRKGLSAISKEERDKHLTKGNNANTGSKASERFASFLSSCGFSAANKNKDWHGTMKSLVYWEGAKAIEDLNSIAWARSAFCIAWGKAAQGARLDEVQTPFQDILKWVLTAL